MRITCDPYVSFVDKLKNLPAPEIAVRYYTEGDLYLFGKSICYHLWFSLFLIELLV